MTTNATCVGKMRSQLQFTRVGVDVVAGTDVWLEPVEGGRESMARDNSYIKGDRWDGRTDGWVLILVAESYDALDGEKLNALNIRALEFNNTTGGSKVSVLSMYTNP